MTDGQAAHTVGQHATIADVRFEHLRDVLGIGTSQPRLSWIVDTSAPGWMQSGYEIEAYGEDGNLSAGTGRVPSDESALVPWPFEPLASRERVAVRVRAWGPGGAETPWSGHYAVEAGLLRSDDWTAQFITPDWEEDTSRAQPAPFLRREFSVRGRLKRARLYVTALGVYELHLNGSPLGDQVLAPGWTSYDHRLVYGTHNVTGMLTEGPNALGAILGDGWYRGRFGLNGGRRNIYGDQVALLAQLEIEYADGTTERVVSDRTWRAASGPILSSNLYDGETYDARLERPGWSMPGYDDGDWAGVQFVDRDLGTLVGPAGPPVRRIEMIEAVAITTSPSGRTIVDFGQNLVGRLRFTVRGEAGQTVTLRHAEVLEGGDLSTRPLRTAQATDRYTLKGGESETWEPRFTFHGFRYAEVEGWPGELQLGDIRAVVLHSDLERIGWFECSDPMLNRLHGNVVWGMRGNFLSIPTDCPQRDERLGWTGDIQVFAPTASFLFDIDGFLTSWLADLAADQSPTGAVPIFVPSIESPGMPPIPGPVSAWGDAAVIVPWVLYQRYGDGGILAAQYESMKAWVDCLAETARDRYLWEHGFQFGDWLDPAAPPHNPAAARTSPYIVANAYFAHSADLLAQTADLLGRTEDAAHYASLARRVRDAFSAEYVTPAGRMMSDAPTAYALALQFRLVPSEERRRHAGERLADLVAANGYHISTGFVGTPLICDALCAAGRADIAYRLLLQRECPSWLYQVTMGATTIWERWDSMLPDGSVNPGEMTSFNHYALGAVADWMHRTVAGLAPGAPRYRRLDIRPQPGGGLSFARARHITPYGPAETGWRIEEGQIQVDVVVPPNTTARVTLPGSDEGVIEVPAGRHEWSYPYRNPSADVVRLSLESTLGDLADQPEAWNAVWAVIVRYQPELARMESGIRQERTLPLQQFIASFPDAEALHADLEAVLASGRGDGS